MSEYCWAISALALLAFSVAIYGRKGEREGKGNKSGKENELSMQAFFFFFFFFFF